MNMLYTWPSSPQMWVLTMTTQCTSPTGKAPACRIRPRNGFKTRGKEPPAGPWVLRKVVHSRCTGLLAGHRAQQMGQLGREWVTSEGTKRVMWKAKTLKLFKARCSGHPSSNPGDCPRPGGGQDIVAECTSGAFH